MALGLANRIGDIREYALAVPILKAPTTCIDMNGLSAGSNPDAYYWAHGDPSMDEEKGWSLVACVNSDLVSTYDTIIGWHYQSVPTRKACCFVVGGNRFQFGCLQGTDTTWDDNGEGIKTTSAVSSDTWYHLVGTGIWDSGSGWDIKFYLNGVAQTGTWSTSGYEANGFTKSGFMTVGLWDSVVLNDESRWDGRCNMIGCYQGVLNSDQVTFLYNNGVPKPPTHILHTVPSVHAGEPSIGDLSDLQQYWKFASSGHQDAEYGGRRIYAYNQGTIEDDYMGA
jgi:hypothetical protein